MVPHADSATNQALETNRDSSPYCFRIGAYGTLVCVTHMSDKTDVWQGTLALMILKTLETLGPQHGYGIARRIEQTSGHRLRVHYGTLYASLLKLDQEGYIATEFYALTRAGRKQVVKAGKDWQHVTDIVSRFFAPGESS